MSHKFDKENTAIAALIKDKNTDCVDALEKGFWQARSTGLGIREAYNKSQFVHYINDHDGLNHEDTLDHNITNDEQVYSYQDKISKEAVNKGDKADEVDLLKTSFFYWYNLHRSWGGDVYLSYVGAAKIVTELYEEIHDLDEAEAIAHINEIPHGTIKNLMRSKFNDLRNEGETVRKSLRLANESAKIQLFKEILFSSFGRRGLIDNEADPTTD